MLNALSDKIAQLAIVIGLLAQALAASPAVYEIRPNSELTQAEIRGAIVQTARQYGVSDVLALAIAKCESNFDRLARSKTSSAKSYFQFIDGTWKQTIKKMGLPTNSDVFDHNTHIQAAIWLLKNEGVKHWESSRSCWEKEL